VRSALVVGSGPNGLAAAITLAQKGVEVTVAEAADSIGGGLRSSELTLPGLLHDHCAAIVPTAVSSPFLQSLDLEAHGVHWAWPDIDLAHSLDNGSAGILYRSLARTTDGLGSDGRPWRHLFGPLSRNYDALAQDLLSPIMKFPRHPLRLGAFGVPAMMPAATLMRIFSTPSAQALFAGNAAHAWTPLSRPPSGAVALMFGAVGHRYGWPAVKGGTAKLAAGLASILRSHGGRIEIKVTIKSVGDVGDFDVVLYDTNPGLPARLLDDSDPPANSPRAIPIPIRCGCLQDGFRCARGHSLDQPIRAAGRDGTCLRQCAGGDHRRTRHLPQPDARTPLRYRRPASRNRSRSSNR
jgi:phytoene dehydrogenase-like protein